MSTISSESCIPKHSATEPLRNCDSTSLHHSPESVTANMAARKDALKALAGAGSGLVRLYAELVETRYHARARERNLFITEAVPFLYRAVSPLNVLHLVGCFYDCNRALFCSSREEHVKDAEAMLGYVTQSYLYTLPEDQRSLYISLEMDEQVAFRICRDLAIRDEPGKAKGEFFMSGDQLGTRLGIHHETAARIIIGFDGSGLLRLVKKGTRRAAGQPGKASWYRWMLPLPAKE